MVVTLLLLLVDVSLSLLPPAHIPPCAPSAPFPPFTDSQRAMTGYYNLKTLIKAIRATKTIADERALIVKESAAIRSSFREEGASRKLVRLACSEGGEGMEGSMRRVSRMGRGGNTTGGTGQATGCFKEVSEHVQRSSWSAQRTRRRTVRDVVVLLEARVGSYGR